jgi:hypothetical protein
MTPDQREADLRLAIDGELRLLRAETRQHPATVDALLDPEFFEFGASGRRWDRAAIVATLPQETAEPGRAASAHDMAAIRLAPGVVLVTYISADGGRLCRRSSIWRETSAGWRVLFHQGTPIPPAAET